LSWTSPRATRSIPTTTRIVVPAALVNVMSSKYVDAPAAMASPTRTRKEDAPSESAAANVAAFRNRWPRSVCASAAIGRASIESRSGNEHGEKNEAMPAPAARARSVAP
jgi:hypothetical protein